MPCVGFRPGQLRVTSYHDKMDLAISALEGPGDIIYHASSLYPYFSPHCLLRMPSESEGRPTAWLQDSDCSQASSLPPTPPRFLHVTKESVLISPQIHPSPRTRNCLSSHNDSSLSFYSAILSPFLSWNILPKGEENWSSWGAGQGGNSGGRECCSWVAVAGCSRARNKFKCVWNNKQKFCALSEETCAALRDLG